MIISVVIASHGKDWWGAMARDRALPSAMASGADEVLICHQASATRAQVRNELTEKAVGDYIVTLDADDELSPGYCEAIRKLEPEDALVVPRVQYVRGHREGAPHFLPHREIWDDNWMVVGTAFPRQRMLDVGGWRTLTGTGTMNEADDWDLWARMTNDGCAITYCEDAVYRAFVDRKSVHRSAGQTQRRKWMEEIRGLNWPEKVNEMATVEGGN